MRSCCSPYSLLSLPDLRSVPRPAIFIPAIWVVFLFASAVGVHGQGMGSVFDRLNNPTAPPASPLAEPRAPLIEKELRLGGDYLVGRGVPRDPVQAAYWYRKAADQGDPQAQNQLGYFYAWGIGVQRDNAEAFRWFARAAGSGFADAKLNLAVLYLKGVGATRDVSLAIQLMSELAEKGDSRAQAYLGILHLAGKGIPHDPSEGEKWLSKAAKHKNPEAEYSLGILWAFTPGHPHDPVKATGLLRKSAHQGYVPAMHALGVVLEQNPAIAAHPADEAILMLQRAAEAGSWASSAALGMLARDGHERPRSLPEAFRWFTIAVRQGGEPAERLTGRDLALCRHSLTSDQQDQETEAADRWLTQHPNRDLYSFDGSGSSKYPIDEVYAPRPGAE